MSANAFGALPQIRYSFVPDLANPVTAEELAVILSELLIGLKVTVNDEFLDRLPVPMHRHFASTQLQTSSPVEKNEPDPKPV